MNNFFSAKSLHLEDHCLVSTAPTVPLIATYGVDSIIHTINPELNTEEQY